MMQRYSGFIQDGYRFEVKVPTTIFDPRIAIVSCYKAYQSRKVSQKVVESVHFSLNEMPEWSASLGCILLSKADEKRLEQKTDELFSKLDIEE